MPPLPARVVAGIGDDAAVVVPDRGALAAVTTDTLVEGIHFDRAHSSPGDIGDKALAVNLSDLAAMGAAPRYALLALSLPADWLVADVDEMLDACWRWPSGTARRWSAATSRPRRDRWSSA